MPRGDLTEDFAEDDRDLELLFLEPLFLDPNFLEPDLSEAPDFHDEIFEFSDELFDELLEPAD